jgi:membrane associated rhomboid family serine protease
MQKTSPVVLNLIIINILAFLAQMTITAINITDWGGLHYFTSAQFKPHQFITYMFLHSPQGFSHILFNMFSLWMFGSFLENYIGSKKFLIFYLLCGLGAGVLTQFTVPFSTSSFANSAEGMRIAAENNASTGALIEYLKSTYNMIGASGSIMGVMAAFAYLFPNTEMYIMFIPVPVKAKYVIPVYVLLDLFGGFYRIPGDNVAHFAHLGGALVGIVIIIYWNKTNRKTFY